MDGPSQIPRTTLRTQALFPLRVTLIGTSTVPAKGGDGLCVFAFRLTEEERDAIRKAAGPARLSKFVRTLAVAAARNYEAAVKAILKGIQNEA
jgi:hypothetical protein